MPADESLILFDLDGVLVDSRAPITACINHALVTHGFAAQPSDELVRFIGPPLIGAFAELTGHAPDSELVLDCVNAYRTLYAEVSLRETTVVPGIVDALTELGQRHRLAVATSKPLVYAEPLLEAMGLRRFFDVCEGPELDASGETKAVTIAAALRRSGPSGGQGRAMVGDRALDIEGAHTCSIPAVAVMWGVGSRAELSAAGPDAIAETPGELPRVLADVLAAR